MAGTFEYGVLDGEGDAAAVAAVLRASFAVASDEDTLRWLDRAGRSNVRLLREGGRTVAALVHVPMGQFFGGREVPMTGIAGVGVEPAMRGRGAARTLMERTVEDLHGRGTPLSVLYPAAQALYRASGYEQAGSRFDIRVPASTIRVRERAASMRRAGAEDRKAVETIYAQAARDRNGHLRRGPYIWARMLEPWREPTEGHLVEEGGGATGYLYYSCRRDAQAGRFDIAVHDLAALTGAAARRILTFLHDHRSLAREVRWSGGPTDPFLLLLPEPSWTATSRLHWMLRVIDVAAALETRGYAPGVAGRLEIEVRDDLLPANAGRFRLEVEAGRGRVSRGSGSGSLRMDVRGLAALYTGHLPPRALRLASLLDGPDEDLALAGSLFAGPAPWMPDMF